RERVSLTPSAIVASFTVNSRNWRRTAQKSSAGSDFHDTMEDGGEYAAAGRDGQYRPSIAGEVPRRIDHRPRRNGRGRAVHAYRAERARRDQDDASGRDR